MATVMDIIQGISQASANAYDGAHDERAASDGEARTAGLKREEGDMNLEARVMDGFNVKFYGGRLCVEYHSGCKLKDTHKRAAFENEVNQHIADITKYLKKEYRKITGSSVNLSEEGEVDILVQTMGRHRSWVNVKKHYTLSGVEGVAPILEPSENRVDKSWKTFLEQGGWKGKRPKNDTRPKNSGK